MKFAPNPEIIASFSENNATFTVFSEGKVARRVCGRGISPALAAFDDGILNGAEVYDTIVGKAAAALFILGGAEAVYAETISDAAVSMLERYGIACAWKTRTPQIINRRGDGLCPFEQAVLDCKTPQDCLPKIRSTFAGLQKTQQKR